jgi:hypothetical protein
MLSNFKPRSLKQKLWLIVCTSAVVRFLIFLALPNTPTSLAPDEGTYSYLTKWIGESKPASDFPLFGEGLYLSGRSIILPASLFFRLGLNELDAVRLVASIYGLGTLVLITHFTLKWHAEFVKNYPTGKSNDTLITSIFLVYTFLPSHFLWSNLGLRESATEFWLVGAFLVFYIINVRKAVSASGLFLLAGSIVLTFSSRPQVGWVLGVSFLIFLLLNLRSVKSIQLVVVVLCAVFVGSTLNLTDSSKVTTSTQSSANLLSGALNPLLTAGQEASNKQEINQLGAASVIKAQDCPRDSGQNELTPPTRFDAYFCIAWRAPYMVSTFLFRPILGVDTTSTSSFIASVENLFWLILIAAFLVLIVKKRFGLLIPAVLPTLIFIMLYVLGASAYQGNMGTGFRHKSLILWAVLSIILVLASRNPKGALGKFMNNSQEEAV